MITYTIEVDERVYPFAPSTQVLARDSDNDSWVLCLFAYCRFTVDSAVYVTVDNGEYLQCIPYKNNEHLHGTCDAAGTAAPHKLNPLQPVLVRDSGKGQWRINLFSHYNAAAEDAYKYICVHGTWRYCLPYEGNEHFLGTATD